MSDDVVQRPTELCPNGTVPVRDMAGEDAEDTRLLREMLKDAEAYLRSFSWCAAVSDAFFGGGIGGVFAVFLFKMKPRDTTISNWMWVITGDIPPAYLPITDASTPTEVFDTYLRGMTRWVELAHQGRTGDEEQGVPPVNAPATREWAENLEHRIEFLRLHVKSRFCKQQISTPGAPPSRLGSGR